MTRNLDGGCSLCAEPWTLPDWTIGSPLLDMLCARRFLMRTPPLDDAGADIDVSVMVEDSFSADDHGWVVLNEVLPWESREQS